MDLESKKIKKSNMKKVALILFIVMIISFTIAGILIVKEGGIFNIGGIGYITMDHNDINNNDKSINNEKIEINDKHIIDDTNSVSSIDIQSVSTTVNIISTDDDKVEAYLHGVANGYEKGKEPKLICEKRDDIIYIKIEYPNLNNYKGLVNRYFDGKLDIKVPKRVFEEFNAKNVSGEIYISDISADKITGTTVSGEVDIKGCKAKYIVSKSTSGSIEINDIIGKVFTKNVSGSIDLDVKELSDEINAEAISGDINLKAPDNADMDLIMKSTSGSLTTDIALKINKSGRNEIRGKVGNGSVKVQLSTVSGDIEVE